MENILFLAELNPRVVQDFKFYVDLHGNSFHCFPNSRCMVIVSVVSPTTCIIDKGKGVPSPTWIP